MDYCTFWPDGVWAHCCAAHDIAYELGRPKIEADLALGQCVKETGNLLTGYLMAFGTLIFGLPWYLGARQQRRQK